MTLTVFIDGLCSPINPNGIATYGLVVYENGLKVGEEFRGLGEGQGMSNNVAEYQGLCAALNWLLDQNLENEEIIVKSDSRLLVNQMNGSWKCRGGLYVAKCREAQSLSKLFTRVLYVWIPREDNSEADNLSRLAYEDYCKTRKNKLA